MEPKHIQNNNGLDDSDTFDQMSPDATSRQRQLDESLIDDSPAKSENIVDDEEELENVKQLMMFQSQQQSKISAVTPNQSNQASSFGRSDNQNEMRTNNLSCLTPQLSQMRAQISTLRPSPQSLVSQSLKCWPKKWQ